MIRTLVSILQFIFVFLLVVFTFYNFRSLDVTIIPINLSVKEDISNLTRNLERLGAPREKIGELGQAIRLASNVTQLSENLILALMFTESSFNYNARSYGNGGKYKGLMQTPTASFIYADVDALHGARILKDKLKIAKGNLPLALALYKGGNNPAARYYADETLKLFKKLEV